MRGVITVLTNLSPWTRSACVVVLEHSTFSRAVLQNSRNNLKPAIISEASENERRVASAVHVLVAKPRFERWKHALVMKRNNLLGYVKLLPEYRRALELLNEAARRLDWIPGGLSASVDMTHIVASEIPQMTPSARAIIRNPVPKVISMMLIRQQKLLLLGRPW